MPLTVKMNEITANARGGTELMMERVSNVVPPDLFNSVQLIPSRVRELEDNPRILWLHDLPEDPESHHLSDPSSLARFDAFVFVSNYQMHRYLACYPLLPLNRCHVIQNGLEFGDAGSPDHLETDLIRLVYHTTPHRGLEILYPVFCELSKSYDNITLDVFSSFKIYGWDQRDQPYQDLFNKLKQHPKITYHGAVPHQQIIDNINNFDIFAYPSIWEETSCLAAIEAAAYGLRVVTTSYGALPETLGSYALYVHHSTDYNDLATRFYHMLSAAITTYGRWKRDKVCSDQILDIRWKHDFNVTIAPLWLNLFKNVVGNQ